MIRLENVSFKYKESNKILDNISFEVHDGEIISIVGKTNSRNFKVKRRQYLY